MSTSKQQAWKPRVSASSRLEGVTPRTRVEDVLAQLTAGLTDSVKAEYRNAWRRVWPRETTVAEYARVTADQLEVAAGKVLEQYKPSTVQHTFMVLRRAWGALRRAQLVEGNPFAGMERIRGAKVPLWNVAEPGEVEKLEKAYPPGSLERAVLLMLGLHGLRAAELAKLTWGSVTEERGDKVIAWRAKMGRVRRMALQPAALAAVLAWRARCGARDEPLSPLVPRRGGKRPLTRFGVTYLVRRACERTLGHRVTAHGLRATYISDVIGRKGIEAARQLAGHESIVTTQRYSRWSIIKDDERKF